MSDRHLPHRVSCELCGREVPAYQARRKMQCFARMGKGGSLSGVKLLESFDIFRCDSCIANPSGEPSLFGDAT